MGNSKKAIECYKGAIDLEPGKILEEYNNPAYLYITLSKIDESIEIAKKGFFSLKSES